MEPRYAYAYLGQEVLSAREARQLPKPKRDLLCCCSCRERVTPVAADGVAYIRHYSPPGGHHRCGTATRESAAHLNAKMFLVHEFSAAAKSDSRRVQVTLECPGCKQPGVAVRGIDLVPGDVVLPEFEISETGLRADVAVVRGDTPICFLEVWASHRVEDSKWDRLAKLGTQCFELDAYDLLNEKTLTAKWLRPKPLPARLAAPPVARCTRCSAPPPRPPAFFSPCSPPGPRTELPPPLLSAVAQSQSGNESPGPHWRPVRPSPGREDPPTPVAAPAVETQPRLRVVDYEVLDGGAVRFRLRQPETLADQIIGHRPNWDDFVRLCAERRYTPAPTPSVLPRPQPRESNRPRMRRLPVDDD